MNLTVTQDNLYLFLPPKVMWVAGYMNKNEGIGVVEAVRRIYSSPIYNRLEREDTKTWHLGPVALYYDMREFTH